jgi:hypothetical protein
MQKWIISIAFNEETLANPGIAVKRIQTAPAARLPCCFAIEKQITATKCY